MMNQILNIIKCGWCRLIVDTASQSAYNSYNTVIPACPESIPGVSAAQRTCGNDEVREGRCHEGTLLKYTALIIIPFLLILSGCDVNNPSEVEDYEPAPMLTAYLYNGEPVEEVYMQWTAPFEYHATAYNNAIPYNPDDYIITDAVIKIFALDNPAVDILILTHDSEVPGHYYSEDDDWLPQGKQKYGVIVDYTGPNIYEDTVTFHLESTTIVPDHYDIHIFHPYIPGGSTIIPPMPDNSLVIEPVMTRDDSSFFMYWNPAPDSGHGYIVNFITMVDSDSLVPLDPDFVIGEDEIEEDEYWRFSIEFMPEDQLQYTMGWYYFNWEGLHQITFMAVSKEYHDYMLAGMNIMQGLDVDMPGNIEGGEGIFGAACRYRMYIELERVENAPGGN